MVLLLIACPLRAEAPLKGLTMPEPLYHVLTAMNHMVGQPWETCLVGEFRSDTAVVKTFARPVNGSCADGTIGIAKGWTANARGECAETDAERADFNATRARLRILVCDDGFGALAPTLEEPAHAARTS